LDEARTGGCSHLPVVAGEHRGFYPPSGCRQIIGELELPSGCILGNYGVGAVLPVVARKQRKLVLPMNVILKY
jgi:hypothetical protein